LKTKLKKKAKENPFLFHLAVGYFIQNITTQQKNKKYIHPSLLII